MPQLEQISTFAGQIFWLAVIFCGLLLVMLKVALPRIQGILQERRGRIDGDTAKAEAMRNEAVEVLREYEEARARARDEARRLIREAQEQAAAAAADRHRALDARLAEELKAAEARIAEARRAALAEIEDVAGEVAQAAVARLVGVEVAPDKAKAAVAAATAGSA